MVKPADKALYTFFFGLSATEISLWVAVLLDIIVNVLLAAVYYIDLFCLPIVSCSIPSHHFP